MKMSADRISGLILNRVFVGKRASQMDGINEIVSRLKFIGKIMPDEKMSVDKLQMQPNDWYTTLRRTFIDRESRRKTLRFISATIDSAFELIKLHRRSEQQSDQTLCINIGTDLRNAVIGISHLMKTYSGDTKFTCDLDVLSGAIIRKLADCNLPIECGTDTSPALPPQTPQISHAPRTPFGTPLLETPMQGTPNQGTPMGTPRILIMGTPLQGTPMQGTPNQEASEKGGPPSPLQLREE